MQKIKFGSEIKMNGTTFKTSIFFKVNFFDFGGEVSSDAVELAP